jgi:hypothetical protein
MIIKRNPHKTLFGKPVPSNLMPILIVLFVVAVVVAVVFKPVQPPQYIVIEPTGEVTKILRRAFFQKKTKRLSRHSYASSVPS